MTRRLLPAGWWRGRQSPGTPFGRLEDEVMQVLWRRDHDLPVRDVQRALARPIAYTTVMTTLDRLYKKGFATRRREGRSFRYTAAMAPHELRAAITSGVVSDLFTSGPAAAPILSNLVDAVAAHDDRLLDELERLVRDKRARLRKAP